MKIFDGTAILPVLGSAMVVGTFVSKVVGTAVFNVMQASNLMWTEVTAIVSSLLAALAAGVGVGWMVRSVWGKVENAVINEKAITSSA